MTKLIMALVATLTLTTSLQAQGTTCKPTKELREALESRFGEVPHITSINSDNNIVEFFGNPETGSWSLVLSNGNGVSCLVNSGNYFEAHDVVVGDPT